jgi:hypothetical protein
MGEQDDLRISVYEGYEDSVVAVAAFAAGSG